jgi:hypothetical protein
LNRYSVITQSAKPPLESSCVVVALIAPNSTSKPLNVSPEKSQILSCYTVVANERYILHALPISVIPLLHEVQKAEGAAKRL